MPKDRLYLGIPLPFGRKKTEVYQYLIQHIHKRVHSWCNHLLSKAGKLVMIQSVLQALPSYIMNCLQLPKWVVNSLNTLIRRFWWCKDYTSLDKHGIYWDNWSLLC